MLSISNLAIVAIQLFTLSHALPVEPTQWKECTAGTQFYTCAINNFKGCCSIDPCALTTGCPDKPVMTSNPAIPAVLARSTCAPGTKAFRQFNPVLKTIDVANSDASLFHISNETAKGSDIQQVFTFANIPASASKIGLFWSISTTVPEFKTSGSATGAVVLLDSSKIDLSAPVLTSAAVSAAIDTSSLPEGAVGGAGFGFWDSPEFPKPHDHIIRDSGLPAKTTLSFRIAIKDQGDVVIRQTDKDGLYLQYDC